MSYSYFDIFEWTRAYDWKAHQENVGLRITSGKLINSESSNKILNKNTYKARNLSYSSCPWRDVNTDNTDKIWITSSIPKTKIIRFIIYHNCGVIIVKYSGYIFLWKSVVWKWHKHTSLKQFVSNVILEKSLQITFPTAPSPTTTHFMAYSKN